MVTHNFTGPETQHSTTVLLTLSAPNREFRLTQQPTATLSSSSSKEVPVKRGRIAEAKQDNTYRSKAANRHSLASCGCSTHL